MNDEVIRNALLNLRNDLKLEIEDHEISRSIKNYKCNLLVAVEMIRKHLGPIV